jgi:hypothetical protein
MPSRTANATRGNDQNPPERHMPLGWSRESGGLAEPADRGSDGRARPGGQLQAELGTAAEPPDPILLWPASRRAKVAGHRVQAFMPKQRSHRQAASRCFSPLMPRSKTGTCRWPGPLPRC